jgi:hypothetical protein
LLFVPRYITAASGVFVYTTLEAVVLLITVAVSFFTTTLDLIFNGCVFVFVLYYLMIADKEAFTYVSDLIP